MEIEIHPPKKEEISELFHLLRICFPAGIGIPEKMEEEYYLSVYEPISLFVGRRLVSNVSIARRKVYIGSQILRAGGIASVATLPEYRGRGYATTLLKKALEEINSEGFHFSPLFTRKPRLYQKLGWQIWPQNFWRVDLSSTKIRKFQQNVEDVEILAQIGTVEMKRIKDIYQGIVPRFIGSLYRDEQYWKVYFKLFIPNFDFFLFAKTKEGRLLGYARCRWEKQELIVGEFMVVNRQQLEKIWITILQIVKDKEKNLPKLIFHLPPSHPVFNWLKVKGVRLHLNNKSREVLMIKIISSRGKILQSEPSRSQFHWRYFDKLVL